MHLHIVSFDVPYPADYGGVIDVFYKIKALHELGVKINLHCFIYGERKRQVELLRYCDQVFYYERKRTLLQQLSYIPFIVSTRKNRSLLENLIADGSPILFEGLHTCAFINHPLLKNRKKFVRMHNIEWQYYQNLFNTEKNIFKKIFFGVERLRLKFFEKKIVGAVEKFFFISPADENYFSVKFKNIFSKKQSDIIYPFHNSVLQFSNFINSKKYYFFSGNLSVPENEYAVRALVRNVFSKKFMGNIPLLVAGKSPSANFKSFIRQNTNVELIENPDDELLRTCSLQALAHILYVEKPAGVKLKLIRALAENKNVVAHINIIPEASWKKYCTVFYSWDDLQRKLNTFSSSKTDEAQIQDRKSLFDNELNNTRNAQKMINAIFRENKKEIILK